MIVDDLQQNIPTGLIGWYPFSAGSKLLYVGSDEDVYAAFLNRLQLDCTVWNPERLPYNLHIQKTEEDDGFDYIVCVAEFEKLKYPLEILKLCQTVLKKSGTLLLGANNRYGLRYFCGDRDLYTGRNFDGIEGYRRAYTAAQDDFCGRTYSKAEIKQLLQQAGFPKMKFYSVLTDLQNPSLIYSENYLPNEDLSNRLFPTYHYPHSVFMEEQCLYDGLIANDMFHQMANAYLVECTIEGELSDVSHITGSLERGKKDALYTIVHDEKSVEKYAVYPEGEARLIDLDHHTQELKARDIAVVSGKLKGSKYVMPYETAEVAQVYLKRLLHTDTELFLKEMDHFRDLILQSSDIVKEDMGDGNGVLLKQGYPDMVPLNAFHKDGTFMFFDQEFCVENCPANALIWRMVVTFYAGDPQANALYEREKLLERYDLQRKADCWRNFEREFLQELRSEKELKAYHKCVRANYNEIHSNRQRINYSAEQYQKLFVDIFDRADTRKLFLFGSGNFTKKFLQIYGNDYKVEAILDNNTDRWGQLLDGVTIQSPDILRDLEPAEYKVIICIKNYLSVMKQLDEMGVGDYSIFDWNKDYPRKMRPIAVASDKENSQKKYHIGYVAGAFDMFHVGHLNLLRRAKELCDYLIVGVLSDETICDKKNKSPIIPEADRVEIVASCRYVDQAELLPVQYNGIMDAYRMFHFDVQFSGNDHVGDADWEREKADLERVGADIVFFDYTEKVSSTKLRKKL
ncbi:MAG: adenylyltransferase/cytidyltransferase family protein [Lachnospiraceae bacterium]|nr:adenylyltransferase/cytidyltransferase family protein [Lachnospiraceae bacterium]